MKDMSFPGRKKRSTQRNENTLMNFLCRLCIPEWLLLIRVRIYHHTFLHCFNLLPPPSLMKFQDKDHQWSLQGTQCKIIPCRHQITTKITILISKISQFLFLFLRLNIIFLLVPDCINRRGYRKHKNKPHDTFSWFQVAWRHTSPLQTQN